MTGRSVVLGLDRSPGAERALELAVRLAQSLDVPLVLVHGVEPAGRGCHAKSSCPNRQPISEDGEPGNCDEGWGRRSGRRERRSRRSTTP